MRGMQVSHCFFSDSPIEHPFACDGFISDGLMLRLIIEYKIV